MSNLYAKNKIQGFSLVETLVYVSVFAVLLMVVLGGTIVLSNAFGEARTDRLILTQGTGALERMLREVRLADDVLEGESVFGAHPGSLKLATVVAADDDTPTTREFFLAPPADGQASTTLVLREGGVSDEALTSGTRITNLVFYAVDAGPSSEAVRVEMTVEAGEGRFLESHTLHGTAVLRRSY